VNELSERRHQEYSNRGVSAIVDSMSQELILGSLEFDCQWGSSSGAPDKCHTWLTGLTSVEAKSYADEHGYGLSLSPSRWETHYL